MKIMGIALILTVAIPVLTAAQLPGDFNCNGTVNGVDATFLIGALSQGLLDTSTCTWRNGDLNSDGPFHTVADWRQALPPNPPPPDRPPLPFEQDTLEIGWTAASPGDMIDVPIRMVLAEAIYDAMFHISLDTAFLDNWRLAGDCFRGGWSRDGEIYCWKEYWSPASPDTLPPGYHTDHYLVLAISLDCPPGTTIPLTLIDGDYYPSGFANISYPTYFIQPILINGGIQVEQSAVDERSPAKDYDIGLTAYPNPFNARTTITVGSGREGAIDIFDITGRKMEVLPLPQESSALGAGLLAAVGLGLYPSVGSLRHLISPERGMAMRHRTLSDSY